MKEILFSNKLFIKYYEKSTTFINDMLLNFSTLLTLIHICWIKTAPHLVKYYIKEHFSRVPGRGYTCCKLLDFHTPISLYIGIFQKILSILVHQEATKLPAMKFFVESKSSILFSKCPDFDAKKTLMAGNFGAPWCTWMSGTFLWHSNLPLIGPQSFAAFIMYARYFRKCWFMY